MNDQHPSRRNLARHKKTDPWWLTQFREHPFKNASLVVLTIGGLMLLTLFGHIGAMPELDLAGASATFAAVAVVGLAVCVSFGGSVLLGGLMLRGNPASSYLVSRGGLVALSAPGMGLAVYMTVRWALDARWVPQGWLLLVPFACSLVLAGSSVWRWEKEDRAKAAEAERQGRWRSLGSKAAGFLAASYIWNLIGILAFMTLLALAPKSDSTPAFLIKLAGWTLICYGINAAVAALPEANEARNIAGFGIGALIILIFLTGNISGIPAGAARGLGLGGDMPVGLVLSPEGCAILNSAARGRAVCKVPAGDSLGWACPVVLRSRIGSPFIVELSAFDDEGYWPRNDSRFKFTPIQIPKSEVRSWPSIWPMPAASAPWTQKTFHVVSYLDDRDMNAVQRQWLDQQCAPASRAAESASAPTLAASSITPALTPPPTTVRAASAAASAGSASAAKPLPGALLHAIAGQIKKPAH